MYKSKLRTQGKNVELVVKKFETTARLPSNFKNDLNDEYAHVHELLHAMQKNLHRAIQQNAEFIANN